MSGSGKAMSPILSAADLATITPSSTNPDITDPKMAGQFRPKGKAVYFRTVTTDAFQGPNMANYFKAKLHVKKVFILDDSGAYGVGLANAFEDRAKQIGIEIVGHDQLDPKEADYTTALTKIKALNPDAIYYGGVAQAGVKLAKQASETVPNMIKAGGDGVAGGSFLKGGGFPAVEGWYGTNAGPHLTESPEAASFVKTFQEKYHATPDDYSITAYDAAKVILAAVEDVAKSGKEMNRSNIRDAIQNSHVKTLQGTVAFDQHGDVLDRTVSVFQYRHDDKYPLDDITHQLKYLEAAPQS
jgi:branched-chain amino acid transport system substrate-binding protein